MEDGHSGIVTECARNEIIVGIHPTYAWIGIEAGQYWVENAAGCWQFGVGIIVILPLISEVLNYDFGHLYAFLCLG